MEYVEDNTKKEARKVRKEYMEASKEERQRLRKKNRRELLYDLVEEDEKGKRLESR